MILEVPCADIVQINILNNWFIQKWSCRVAEIFIYSIFKILIDIMDLHFNNVVSQQYSQKEDKYEEEIKILTDKLKEVYLNAGSIHLVDRLPIPPIRSP